MLTSKYLFLPALALATVPTLAVVPEFIGRLDSWARPVVIISEVTPVRKTESFYELQVVGYKRRPCKLLPPILGYTVTNGILKETSLTFPGDTSPGSSRPMGAQDFGIWRFSIEEAPAADHVLAYVWHDCRSPWSVFSQLGPWTVEETVDD